MNLSKAALTGIFALNVATTLMFWWLGSASYLTSGKIPDILIGAGRLAGLLAELFILVQLVLISRIRLVERAYGFDELNRLHRLIGYGLTFGILCHPLLLIFGYSGLSGTGFWAQFFDFLTNWEDVLKALLGLLLLVGIGLLSMPVMRKKLHYDTWYTVHLGMYGAIALFFGHQVNTADVSFGAGFAYWYALNFGVFGLLLAYRFIGPLLMFYRQRFYVEKVIPETFNVNSVYIKGRQINRFLFDPGQHIHAYFLSKGMWQHHPFSLSLPPNGEFLRLSIKAVGDYTKKIPELAPGTKVILEGPFGKFTERAAVKDKYLLIAGGIGITPIRSLFESLRAADKDAVLLYGNRSLRETALKAELEKINGPIHFIFSEVKEEGHPSGRIDLAFIERKVPDFRERDIYICGPAAMLESLRRELKKSGVPKRQIHYEKFSY